MKRLGLVERMESMVGGGPGRRGHNQRSREGTCNRRGNLTKKPTITAFFCLCMVGKDCQTADYDSAT